MVSLYHFPRCDFFVKETPQVTLHKQEYDYQQTYGVGLGNFPAATKGKIYYCNIGKKEISLPS